MPSSWWCMVVSFFISLQSNANTFWVCIAIIFIIWYWEQLICELEEAIDFLLTEILSILCCFVCNIIKYYNSSVWLWCVKTSVWMCFFHYLIHDMIEIAVAKNLAEIYVHLCKLKWGHYLFHVTWFSWCCCQH